MAGLACGEVSPAAWEIVAGGAFACVAVDDRFALDGRPRYNDLWIAAQAIERGYALLTLNQADFAGLPGLKLLRPT